MPWLLAALGRRTARWLARVGGLARFAYLGIPSLSFGEGLLHNFSPRDKIGRMMDYCLDQPGRKPVRMFTSIKPLPGDS